MDRERKIRIKKEIEVTELDGEKVMIDFDSGRYFLIKGVGNDIWDMLQQETTPADIIAQLLSEYDVAPEVCETQVMAFLDKIAALDFI